jgi:hypothetical protein
VAVISEISEWAGNFPRYDEFSLMIAISQNLTETLMCTLKVGSIFNL